MISISLNTSVSQTLTDWGQFKREVNVLVAAHKERVPQDLLLSRSLPFEVSSGRLVAKLHDDVGMAIEFAELGVAAWGAALRLVTSEGHKEKLCKNDNEEQIKLAATEREERERKHLEPISPDLHIEPSSKAGGTFQ